MSNELKRLIHAHCIDSDDPVGAMDNFLDWMIGSRQSYVDNDTDKIPIRDKMTELNQQDGWWRGDETS